MLCFKYTVKVSILDLHSVYKMSKKWMQIVSEIVYKY